MMSKIAQIENGQTGLVSRFHVPDPLVLVNRENQLIPLWGFKKPKPLLWYVKGLLPEKYATIMAADGGSGKSYLAIYLALCICFGIAFFGLRTRRGRVLFVDYELDEEEQKRRVWRILNGMEMTVDDERLEDRFFYFRPDSPLSDRAVHDDIVRYVEENDIDLVILDSLTMGLGGDAKDQREITSIMQQIVGWGTTLIIDHIPSDARHNTSTARPFGSVFKRNAARSVLVLTSVEGGGRLLRTDKSNFGPRKDHVCYEQKFIDEGETVVFNRLKLTDEKMAGAIDHLSTRDITLVAIQELFKSGKKIIGVEDVAHWRDENGKPLAIGTIRNHLSGLKAEGRIESIGTDSYRPVHGADDTLHDQESGADKSDERVQGSRFHGSHLLRDRESENGGQKYVGGDAVRTPDGVGVVVETPLDGSTLIPVRISNGTGTQLYQAGQLTRMAGPPTSGVAQ